MDSLGDIRTYRVQLEQVRVGDSFFVNRSLGYGFLKSTSYESFKINCWALTLNVKNFFN